MLSVSTKFNILNLVGGVDLNPRVNPGLVAAHGCCQAHSQSRTRATCSSAHRLARWP
jgi:hypothetical protein